METKERKQDDDNLVFLPLERLSRNIGSDDLNICEFPLFSMGRATTQGRTTLIFEDQITDHGKRETVHRKLIVAATEAFGLPTPFDSDVFLLLRHLSAVRNGFTQCRVPFTRYELLNFLGYDHGGKSYRRLDEALRRLSNVTLNYDRAWWSRSGQRWESKSFHILESIDLRGRRDHRDDGLSSFTWNEIIMESFRNHEIKRLDLDTYFRLKSPTAKQAYRFLDKRFYKEKSLLEFKLRVFACEKVGLSRSHDTGKLKEKLQGPLEELEEIGFLAPLSRSERYVKLGPNDWQIRLIRNSEKQLENGVMEGNNRPPRQSDLSGELTRRGVHARTAAELAGKFPKEQIEAQLAYHDWLLARGGKNCPTNPPAFLAAAIREGYQPPASFRKPPMPGSTRPTVRLQKQRTLSQEESAKETRRAEAEAFFRSLSPAEQTEIESLAVQNGSSFFVQAYWSRKESGGPIWEAALIQLIAELLAKRPEIAHLKRASCGV